MSNSNKTGDDQRITMLFRLHLMYILSSLCTTLGVKGILDQSGIHNATSVCDTFLCFCGTNSVSCTIFERKHSWIFPKLPANTTYLYLYNSYLPVINAATFSNVAGIQLQKLKLSDNEVKNISRNAFQYLTFLKELYLSQEPKLKVAELKNAFASLNKNTIQLISLNVMEWFIIDEQLFGYLDDSGLVEIDLSKNQLRTIDFKIFSRLLCLSKIELSHNNLKEVKIDTVENLEYLHMSNNVISKIPSFCGDKSETKLPKLKFLDLSANKITELGSETFKCLPNLGDLRLRENPLEGVWDNFISSLPFIINIDLSKSIDVERTRVNDYAFNSSSLMCVILEDGSLYFDPFYFRYEIFWNCPNLTELRFSHTKLPQDQMIMHFFSNITRIENLNSSFSGMTLLPEESLSQMTSLKVLDLQGNHLQTWNGTKAFINSRIASLSMAGNAISELNSTSFPPSMLNYLDVVDLSNNPYLCTCQTLGSINWIRRHADILVNYPDSYRCFSPSDMSGVRLIDYNPSAESCTEKNIPLLVSVPVSIIAVTTMSVIFLVYRCRWRLRYGFYLFNNRYKKYDRLADSYGFDYAGFVIYCDADRTWVHNELIHRLEDQEGFRLCIRLRDFDVGKVHVDNIVDNMTLSEKIIVVLSNNFARDEWCDFQLLLAETRLLKQNTDMLVIFMIEEIKSDCLRASLFKLVTERQFALWSDDGIGKDLFWKEAVLQMKKSTAKNYGTVVT